MPRALLAMPLERKAYRHSPWSFSTRSRRPRLKKRKGQMNSWDPTAYPTAEGRRGKTTPIITVPPSLSYACLMSAPSHIYIALSSIRIQCRPPYSPMLDELLPLLHPWGFEEERAKELPMGAQSNIGCWGDGVSQRKVGLAGRQLPHQ